MTAVPDRRLRSSLAIVMACASIGAPSALAAPGLTPLGGPQIGLPAGDETEATALAEHRGQAYAAVIRRANRRGVLQVERFDPLAETWLPVAGPLSNVDHNVVHSTLLSTSRGELFAAWVEQDPHADSLRAFVARLAPDGRGWEHIMQAAVEDGRVRLAQAGDEVWVGWQQTRLRARFARYVTGRIEQVDVLPVGARLLALVGYGAHAYIGHSQPVFVPHHRDRTGNYVPDRSFVRLRMARLGASPDDARLRLSDVGAWDLDHGDSVFLSAGRPGSSTRPILGFNTDRGITLMRLRIDRNGFDPFPVAPLMTLRGIRSLRGINATPSGMTIAADAGLDRRLRVYTITGEPAALAITDGDELPQANAMDEVSMVPAPAPAPDGAVVLAYNTRALRAVAMRYAPVAPSGPRADGRR